MKILLTILIIFTAIFLFSKGLDIYAQSPAAKTYYIDGSNSSASDNNNGLSKDKAWKSLSKIQKIVLHPGDTIKLNGIFTEQAIVLPLKASGTREKPILITSLNSNNKAKIIGGKLIGNKYLQASLDENNYIVIDGIRLSNSEKERYVTRSTLVKLHRSDNNVIRNSEFEWVAIEISSSSSNIIEKNSMSKYGGFDNPYTAISDRDIKYPRTSGEVINIIHPANSTVGSNNNIIRQNNIEYGGHSLITVGAVTSYPVNEATFDTGNKIQDNNLSNPWYTIMQVHTAAKDTIIEGNRFENSTTEPTLYSTVSGFYYNQENCKPGSIIPRTSTTFGTCIVARSLALQIAGGVGTIVRRNVFTNNRTVDGAGVISLGTGIYYMCAPLPVDDSSLEWDQSQLNSDPNQPTLAAPRLCQPNSTNPQFQVIVNKSIINNQIYHNVIYKNTGVPFSLSLGYTNTVKAEKARAVQINNPALIRLFSTPKLEGNLIANNIIFDNNGLVKQTVDSSGYQALANLKTSLKQNDGVSNLWPDDVMFENTISDNMYFDSRTSSQPETYILKSSIGPDGKNLLRQYKVSEMEAKFPSRVKGNLNNNPRFANLDQGKFVLSSNSPAIDKGLVIPGEDYIGKGPDIGKIEFSGERSNPLIGYTLTEDLASRNSSSVPNVRTNSPTTNLVYQFKDKSVGLKTIYTRFFYSDGSHVDNQKVIKYALPSPTPTPIQSGPTKTPTKTPTNPPTKIPSPTPKAVDNNKPIGYVVYPNSPSASCSTITGWSCDLDKKNKAIQVDFWDYTSTPKYLGPASASIDLYNGPDLQSVCGHPGVTINHGYRFNIPSSVKDNTTHKIRGYGININSYGLVLPAGHILLTTIPTNSSNEVTLKCAP